VPIRRGAGRPDPNACTTGGTIHASARQFAVVAAATPTDPLVAPAFAGHASRS
jgi:hypothetical protein